MVLCNFHGMHYCAFTFSGMRNYAKFETNWVAKKNNKSIQFVPGIFLESFSESNIWFAAINFSVIAFY